MQLSRSLPLLLLGLASLARADYSFLVTNSPSGSNPGPYTNGILRYNVDSAGNAAAGTGIAASADIVDPVGLALSSSGELYVGNRFGNDLHPGSGFVSTFHFDASTSSYVHDATIPTNATGTHGVNVSPTTGELFAANVNGPVSRFLGTTANGTLNSGSARDVLISPDGQFAYVTQGINGDVLKFNVASGAYINTFSVAGASALHFGAWQGGDLYIADYGNGHVYDLTFNGSGDVATATAVAAAAASISVAFSPDGTEMFVPGHTTGFISKFRKNGSTWAIDGQIPTGVNMGDIQIVPAAVPEPATLAVLGVGALALVRRRRKA